MGDRGRIAIRTKFFDDAVVAAISDGAEHDARRRRIDVAAAVHRIEKQQGGLNDAPSQWQVVLLGAGLDTRAWRLAPAPGAAPARAVFELDVPEAGRSTTPLAPHRVF